MQNDLSRVQLLLHEKQTIDDLLAATPADNVMARAGLEYDRRRLVQKLAELDERHIYVGFSGEPVALPNAISAAFAGQAVKHLADVVRALSAGSQPLSTPVAPMPPREELDLLITGMTTEPLGFQLLAPPGAQHAFLQVIAALQAAGDYQELTDTVSDWNEQARPLFNDLLTFVTLNNAHLVVDHQDPHREPHREEGQLSPPVDAGRRSWHWSPDHRGSRRPRSWTPGGSRPGVTVGTPLVATLALTYPRGDVILAVHRDQPEDAAPPAQSRLAESGGLVGTTRSVRGSEFNHPEADLLVAPAAFGGLRHLHRLPGTLHRTGNLGVATLGRARRAHRLPRLDHGGDRLDVPDREGPAVAADAVNFVCRPPRTGPTG